MHRETIFLTGPRYRSQLMCLSQQDNGLCLKRTSSLWVLITTFPWSPNDFSTCRYRGSIDTVGWSFVRQMDVLPLLQDSVNLTQIIQSDCKPDSDYPIWQSNKKPQCEDTNESFLDRRVCSSVILGSNWEKKEVYVKNTRQQVEPVGGGTYL